MHTRRLCLVLACAGLLSLTPACGDSGQTEGETSESETGDGDGDPATGDGDGDPTTTGDGDGDPLEDGECRSPSDCQDPEFCFAPGEPNCGPCMDGFDECTVDQDCGDPMMVCGFADPGCWCNGPPRTCVQDCNVGGCDPHETCGNDGLCTRDQCAVDDDCSDDPGFCVKGQCYSELGMCEFIAP